MAQPAQVGPYIANLQLEQRRRELKAARFEPLAEAAFDDVRLMFALQEHNHARAKEQIEGLTFAAAAYGGWKNMPQSALNAYGGSVDVMAGHKVVPRDPQGNVLPPEVSLDQEMEQLAKALKPEEKEKLLKRKIGILPTAGEEAKLDIMKWYDTERLAVERLRINAANEREAARLDERQQQLNLEAGRLLLAQDTAIDRTLSNTLSNLAKEKSPTADMKRRDLWNGPLRQRMLLHGIDIGSAPPPATLMDRINELLGRKHRTKAPITSGPVDISAKPVLPTASEKSPMQEADDFLSGK